MHSLEATLLSKLGALPTGMQSLRSLSDEMGLDFELVVGVAEALFAQDLVDLRVQREIRAGAFVPSAARISITPTGRYHLLMNDAVNESSSIHDADYDLFICHASEDKLSLVDSLAAALIDLDYSVFFDAVSILPGDSLTSSINNGLKAARHGLVILSDAFFKKHWTERELSAIFTLTMKGKQVLLPIFWNYSPKQLEDDYPLIADIKGLIATGKTPSEVALELDDALNKRARRAGNVAILTATSAEVASFDESTMLPLRETMEANGSGVPFYDAMILPLSRQQFSHKELRAAGQRASQPQFDWSIGQFDGYRDGTSVENRKNGILGRRIYHDELKATSQLTTSGDLFGASRLYHVEKNQIGGETPIWISTEIIHYSMRLMSALGFVGATRIRIRCTFHHLDSLRLVSGPTFRLGAPMSCGEKEFQAPLSGYLEFSLDEAASSPIPLIEQLALPVYTMFNVMNLSDPTFETQWKFYCQHAQWK